MLHLCLCRELPDYWVCALLIIVLHILNISPLMKEWATMFFSQDIYQLHRVTTAYLTVVIPLHSQGYDVSQGIRCLFYLMIRSAIQRWCDVAKMLDLRYGQDHLEGSGQI